MKKPLVLKMNLVPEWEYGTCVIRIPKWVELAYRPKTWRKIEVKIFSKPQKYKHTFDKEASKYYKDYSKRRGYKEKIKQFEDREQKFWDKYWECKEETHKSKMQDKQD